MRGRAWVLGLARRDRKWPLNDGQIPNPNVDRVDPGTVYYLVVGDRRASRNGPVSDISHPKPHVTIRTFCIAR
jgi:hypothetical protein